MRSFAVSVATFGCLFAAALPAAAQKSAPSPGPSKRVAPLGPMRRALDTDSLAAAARRLAASGNCAKAVDLLDQVITLNADPVLRRDRGLCHEKLGNVFPAIDDLRAYLVERGAATDADDMRARLASLEGVPAPKPTGPDDDIKDQRAKSFSESVAAQRLRDDSRNSGYREGKGTVVSIGLGPHRIKLGEGAENRWGPELTLRVGYSSGPTFTLFGQLSALSVGTLNRTGATAGYGGALGIEARAPLDEYYTNQLFLSAALGALYFTPRGLLGGAQSQGQAVLAIQLPRLRGGYRHVFGAHAALDLGLDASLYSARFVGTASPGATAGSDSYLGVSYGASAAIGLAF